MTAPHSDSASPESPSASIAERVRAWVAEIAEVEQTSLRDEMDLVADLNFNSAKAMRLLVEIEDAFDVEIEDEDAAKLSTVGDVVRYVESAT